MAENIDNLKNLSPEERIRRLREIEEIDKKEIDEVKRLIGESEEEIEEKINIQRRIPIPQIRATDTSTLFGRGTQEDLMHAAHRFRASPDVREQPAEPDLETIVTPAREQTLEEEVGGHVAEEEREYRLELIRYSPAKLTLERIDNIRYTLAHDTNTTKEHKDEILQELAIMVKATGRKMADWYDGAYQPTEDASRALVQSYKVAKQLLDMYKG